MVISEPTSQGCSEHKVRYTCSAYPRAKHTEQHRKAGWNNFVHNSGFWKGKEGHYSPSKRASWTSDIIQISLNVRAWCVGKITSLSLDSPQVPPDPVSPSIHSASVRVSGPSRP